MMPRDTWRISGGASPETNTAPVPEAPTSAGLSETGSYRRTLPPRPPGSSSSADVSA